MFLPRVVWLLGRDGVEARVGTEHLWYHHGAIGLLVVLQNGNHHTRKSQPGAIYGVGQLRALSLGGPVADTGSPSLEVGASGAGTDFKPLLAASGPDFNVVSLGRLETDVPRAELEHPVR